MFLFIVFLSCSISSVKVFSFSCFILFSSAIWRSPSFFGCLLIDFCSNTQSDISFASTFSTFIENKPSRKLSELYLLVLFKFGYLTSIKGVLPFLCLTFEIYPSSFWQYITLDSNILFQISRNYGKKTRKNNNLNYTFVWRE